MAQYAYIYSDLTETVPIEGDVAFDVNGVLTSDFTHVPGTSQITVLTAGTYKVTYSVSGTEPNQMALCVNGVAVPGSIYGSGAGTQQNTGQAIFAMSAGDVLTLRNHSSAAAVALFPVVGGTQPAVDASVLIEELG